MSKFFTQSICDRCGGSLQAGRTMSMYNTDCICLKCKREEVKRPDYEKARQAEADAVANGDRNFPGIGFNKGEE